MKLKALPLAASVLALSTLAVGAQTATTPDATTGTGQAGMETMQDREMMGGSGVIGQQNYNSLISADELLGANIYSMNAGYDETTWNETRSYTAMDANWEDIGEIDDIVMSPDGRLIGLAVETGGWLDIGDDVVLIDLNDVRMVNENGTFSVVTRMTQEELEAKPELNENWWAQ